MKKMLMLFVLLSSLVFASNYKYEITPTIGGVLPEGNLDLNDQLTYGLRFGINVDSIFDQVEFGIDRSDNVDYDNSAKSTDITRYFVNLIKSYPLKDKLSLYSLIGLGYENLSTDAKDNDDSGFFNYGLGLKYAVNDNFSLRAEVRHAIKFDHGDNNLFYTVGFVIPFGKKAEPMAAPAPAPKPVVIGDDDNDGVNNNMDNCPQTKVGVKVDANGCELDSDNDGILDSHDKCPQTKAGVEVDANGCAINIDSDHDGVVDSQDLCPNTPAGNVVDSDGCVKVIRLHVTFATNKADISQAFMTQIKKVADFMKINQDYKVILEGNTDSTGSKKYNQQLSLMRANAVSDALEGLGVNPDKITTKGLGESNPIATNKTKEGRAQNRRVDAKFIK